MNRFLKHSFLHFPSDTFFLHCPPFLQHSVAGSERRWKEQSWVLVSLETTLATATAPGGSTCQSVMVRTSLLNAVMTSHLEIQKKACITTATFVTCLAVLAAHFFGRCLFLMAVRIYCLLPTLTSQGALLVKLQRCLLGEKHAFSNMRDNGKVSWLAVKNKSARASFSFTTFQQHSVPS